MGGTQGYIRLHRVTQGYTGYTGLHKATYIGLIKATQGYIRLHRVTWGYAGKLHKATWGYIHRVKFG